MCGFVGMVALNGAKPIARSVDECQTLLSGNLSIFKKKSHLSKNEYCLKQTYEELLLILGAKRVIATG